MNISIESSSSKSDSDESFPECHPWQDEDTFAEEHIAQTINDWLAQHGKALFALETSKFLVKINKELKATPSTPKKKVVPAHDDPYWDRQQIRRDNGEYVKSFYPPRPSV